MAAPVIPHGRRHDAAVAGDARHLAQPCHGIRHEVDDELRERGVELVLCERQLLGRRALDRDSRVAFADGVDERLRRIDGRHGFLAQPPHELGRQRARPATDVEHATLGAGEVGEQRRQRHRVPAHEPVVRLRSDGERHEPTLREADAP